MTTHDHAPVPAPGLPAANREAPALSRKDLVAELGRIVGAGHVLTSERDTRGYTRGFRYGGGPVAAVVRPGSLVEQWRVLNAAIAAGRAVIFQAANTGLTGGSTPWGDDYDREIVLVSLRRLKGVHLIDGGRQVVCLPGATLDALEKALRPARARAAFGDRLVLHRRLGARRHLQQLGRRADPARAGLHRDEPLSPRCATTARSRSSTTSGCRSATTRRRSSPAWSAASCPNRSRPTAWASDRDYGTHVRDVDADTPARFNADPRRLREAAGCAGKLAVFAVRLDTFEAEKETAVFYIGTNDPDELTAIRRHILANFEQSADRRRVHPPRRLRRGGEVRQGHLPVHPTRPAPTGCRRSSPRRRRSMR